MLAGIIDRVSLHFCRELGRRFMFILRYVLFLVQNFLRFNHLFIFHTSLYPIILGVLNITSLIINSFAFSVTTVLFLHNA